MSPRRRGAAAIEFALWQPILFLLLAGVVDLSTYLSRQALITRATHDGARAGAATAESSDDDPGSLVVPAAKSQAETVLGTMNVQCPDGVSATYELVDGISYVRVDVACPFDPLIGLFTFGGLGSSFTMALEAQTHE